MTALGTYLLVSLFFVLATMIEFAFVLLLKEKFECNTGQALPIQCNCNKTTDNTTGNGNKSLAWRLDDSMGSWGSCETWVGDHGRQKGISQELASTKISHLTKKIDYTSLVLFNLSYCIFNIFYFHYHK